LPSTCRTRFDRALHPVHPPVDKLPSLLVQPDPDILNAAGGFFWDSSRALTIVTAVPRNVQDGLAAVHWAAIKGHKEVLKFLIEGAPENNRADPLIVDKDNWSALMWAIFMAESAGKGDNLSYAHPRLHLNAIRL